MFNSPKISLSDLLGNEFINAVASASEVLGEPVPSKAFDAVDFMSFPRQSKNDELLKLVGSSIVKAYPDSLEGAATDAFRKATNKKAAPLTGIGPFRVGEDGKLYFIGKSEHYQASLGHRFEGYKLIDKARMLGILNPTHNNTRGYITRLLERRLIQTVNKLEWEDDDATGQVLSSKEPKVLNRVINLETGSLAVEAGVKMMLTRFYRLDPTFKSPEYAGKTPVFLVSADRNNGTEANYHGTTTLTQSFRGMWPDLYVKAENSSIYKVVPIEINNIDRFRETIRLYNNDNYKTAGFLHEIILMNYGGVRMEPEFLKKAYELCAKTDTPVLVDEIQSCAWYESLMLFNDYGLKPDFVALGKGFSGGEYPASKIITTAEMDTLNLFGALVTNGQEDLASLSYLVTMAFINANRNKITELGNYFYNRLCEIQIKHCELVSKIEGKGHLATLHFSSVEKAASVAQKLNASYIDASAQLYKANCPPAVLLKPPVISSKAALDFLIGSIEKVLDELCI